MASPHIGKSRVLLASPATTSHGAGGHLHIRESGWISPIDSSALQDSQRIVQTDKDFQRIAQAQGSEEGDAIKSDPGDLQHGLKYYTARRHERTRNLQNRLSNHARQRSGVLHDKAGNPPASTRSKPVNRPFDGWVDRVKSPRTRRPFYSDAELDVAQTLVGMRNTRSGAQGPEDRHAFGIGDSAIPLDERAPGQDLPDRGPSVVDACPRRDEGIHLESCIFGGTLVHQPPSEARRPPSTQRIRSSSCFSSPDLPPLPGKMFPDLEELDI